MPRLKFKFCPSCGTALRTRYPGGDPEAGPARPECPNCSLCLDELIDAEVMNAVADVSLRDFLEDHKVRGMYLVAEKPRLVQVADSLTELLEKAVDLERYLDARLSD